jgi:hypothetical protein
VVRPWQGDLARSHAQRQEQAEELGGLTGDNIGVEYAGVVYGIAESPLGEGMIWVGTNDGQVQAHAQRRHDVDESHEESSDLPPWGFCAQHRGVAIRRGHGISHRRLPSREQSRSVRLRTTDYGRTWKKIVNGIPRSNLSYAKVIYEDPKRRGMLYLGTENAIYVTFDDGETWQPLQNDLPAAPVSGILVQEHFDDLVISTYGRGFYILDDLGALRGLTPAVLAKDSHLFAIHPTYRFRPITAPSSSYDDPTVGENPQYGASINYYMKAPAATAPKITVLDAAGATVRTLTGTNVAGINRIYWDLRYTPSTQVVLRTSPMYAPHIVPGPNGRNAPGTNVLSILAAPGRYTVKLEVNGTTQTQQVVVRKDPNSGGIEGRHCRTDARAVRDSGGFESRRRCGASDRGRACAARFHRAPKR